MYQVKLDWVALALPAVSPASSQPSQLSCLGSSVGRASVSQAVYRGFESHPSSSFFIGKEMFSLVLLSGFRSSSSHIMVWHCWLPQDFNDSKQLLSSSNIDQTSLKRYAREAATYATDGALTAMAFEKNHR